MSLAALNGHAVAVCIVQPFIRLVLPDGSIWEAESTPLRLDATSTPAPTVLGFDGQRPPAYLALARALTVDELAAEAILVPFITAYVPLLRAAGFRGQILSPRLRPMNDGKVVAHHATVIVLADADPLQHTHHCGQCGWSGNEDDFHACPGLPGENQF